MTPYYDEDGITLYHGDCSQVLPTLNICFDLVFTSPPYNLGVSTGGGFEGIGHYRRDAGYRVCGGR